MRDRTTGNVPIGVLAVLLLLIGSWAVKEPDTIEELAQTEWQRTSDALGPDALTLVDRLTSRMTEPVYDRLDQLSWKLPKLSEFAERARFIIWIICHRIISGLLWLPVGIGIVVMAGLKGLSGRAKSGAGLGYPSPAGFMFGKWCWVGAVIAGIAHVAVPIAVGAVWVGLVLFLLAGGTYLLGRNLPGRI